MGLIDKIRIARQRTVKAGGMDFIVRRPTDLEVATMQGAAPSPFEIVLRFTIGWTVKESDVISSGTDASVPWDADLFAEWIADRPELWAPLSAAVMEAYASYRDATEGAAKN